ncbi:TPA: hypothetical protein DD449_00525 [Candidatus Berkelbacteria bacterium]|uniref:Uncharacterized protein n=1 Tax=Berkelbacteria bacterium GW2011_GWE1_39_12 TaxID=1618337 RepID=A0A0G4B5T7_9BACT|nr:MAG: hypothetical protein UT28_C0001G0982 [Berkelbacteria bacterium GW2011_GWE1_39_12]HBO60156.1 hypothetical protein [Candidatus Berkelbacteria bacterium]
MIKENLIFFDTEFSSLNPNVGEILSAGFIKDTGEELYFEIDYSGPTNEWVKENILPTLKQEKISKELAVKKIQEFIGDSKPILVAFVNQFDVVYLHKLFGENDIPYGWPPIDLATLMVVKGLDVDKYYENQKEYIKKLGIKGEFIQHNALDDARLVKEVYYKIT